MHIRILLAVSALAVAPAHAANDQVQRGPVPDWVRPSELMPVPEDVSGQVFVRRQDSLVHLDQDGQAQYLGYRIKILHPNALQIGNLSIAWNPAAGAPTVHAIKVHRGSEVRDVLESTSFEILRREGQLESAMLDGLLTAVLQVPDVRVGDELEVALTTREREPTLGADTYGLLFLAPEPPLGRFRLGLSWENGEEPDLRMSADMEVAAERGSRTVDIRFDNPTAVTLPKDAPPRYLLPRIVEYSDFADWAAVSRRFAPLYAEASSLGEGSVLRKEAERIAAAHHTSLERASAALKLVQQEVRYIYVGLDGGNFTPATAEETWQRRYGDCKGKTALLLALLDELGIEAEPVLANNTGVDDGLNERLPNPGLFDHVLVRAKIDGANYWLDGTLPPVVAPGQTPLMPYRWVLPLSTVGGSIEQLEWRPAERPDELTLYEIDARAGFDEARITMTTILRGIRGLREQVQFSSLTPGQLRNGFRQQLVGDTWQAIEDVDWRYDAEAQASVLTVTGTGTVDWDDDGDGSKSLSLPGGGFSPPERRVRSADQAQDLPYYKEPKFDCRVTTVRLPETTQARHWSFNSGYDTQMFGATYHRAFEIRDGAIRMVRGFRVEQPEVDAATVRRDNARIADFNNSMAWIYYDPHGERPPARNTGPVPATYEIDWAAESVPCLGPHASTAPATQVGASSGPGRNGELAKPAG